MKKNFFFCILFFVNFFAFSADLFVKKTKYFDIIYSSKSEASAAVLAKNADKIFDELAEIYQLKKSFRLPVTINYDYQVFNAYFSFAPFNHIVLYDALPNENSNFSDEIFLNTFRHELTHAITMNLQTGFWKGVKNVFGDSANIGGLFDTTFMIEGAAVETESKNGDGRTNNGFSLQLLKQAKIEGNFPKFSEVQGALDFGPGRTVSYIFGGAFWEWIVKKYGQEKFANFWWRCSNFRTFTYQTCFKSVYGESFFNAWNEFYDSIKVPEIVKNPLKKEGFYEFAIKNQKGESEILSSSKKMIALADSSKIFIAPKNEESQKIKAKKILTQKNVKNLSFSADSRFLAVNYNSYSSKFPKKKALIYDTQKKSVFHFKQDGISNCGIFQNGKNYYFVVEKSGGKDFKNVLNPVLVVYKIEFSKKSNKIKNLTEVFKANLGNGNATYSYCGTENGILYFILKNAHTYSLYSLKNEENNFSIKKVFDFPGEMQVQNLSLCFENINLGEKIIQKTDKNEIFIFSYASKEDFPKFGFVNVDFSQKKIDLILSKTETSGANFYPVVLNEKAFAWKASFFNYSNFIYSDFKNFSFAEQNIEFDKNFFTPKNEAIKNLFEIDFSVLSDSKKFGVKDFVRRGTWIPFYSLGSSHRISNSLNSVETSGVPLGTSYISGSPWTFPLYGFSVAYDYYSNSGIFTAFLYGKTDTSIFNYSSLLSLEIDQDGYKQIFNQTSVSSTLQIFKNWSLVLSDSFNFLHGRQNFSSDEVKTDFDIFESFAILRNPSSKKWIFAKNEISSLFTNIRKCGSGTFEQIGINFGPNFSVKYFSLQTDLNKNNFFGNLGLSSTVQLPFLFPIRDKSSIYTYNFPISVKAMIFPTESYFMAFSGNLVLFSAELQKSFNILPFNLLYFNRITVYLSYLAKFSDSTEDSFAIFDAKKHFSSLFDGSFSYSDLISLNCKLTLTPNFGGLANYNYSVSLNGAAFYRFYKAQDEKRFGLSFSYAFNF